MVDVRHTALRSDSRSLWSGLLLVLLVAACLRLVTYFEIADGPLPHLHAWTQSDMHFFDGWAREITAGDLLTENGSRPYHGRHIKLACRAFVLRGGEHNECTQAEVRRIWDAWVGSRSLWQDPGYPYFVAALYAAIGRSPFVVYAAQSALGLVSVAMVYLIAWRLFDRRAAVAAGLLAALFGPLVFYETVMLRAVPIAAVGLGACLALIEGTDARRVRHGALFIAGLLAGLLCLLKASWFLTVAAWAVVLALSVRCAGLRRASTAVGAFAAGVMTALLPLFVRNAMLGLPVMRSAATGPINFINGNAADRVVGGGSAISDLAAEILVTTGGAPAATAAATVATHESVIDWFGLVVAKLVMFFDAREIPNNVSYDYFLEYAGTLNSFSVGFALVAALAALGLVAASPRREARMFVLAYIVTGIAVCALFFNLSRFRLPIACMMLPLAGGGYSMLASLVRRRRWLALFAALAVAVAAVLAMETTTTRSSQPLRLADYGVANEIAVQIARRAVADGDRERALKVVLSQLEGEPPALTAIEPSDGATSISVWLSGVAGTFVGLHEMVDEIAAAAPGELDGATVDYHRRRARVLRQLNAPYAAAGLE